MSQLIDLTGQVFERLTVIERAENNTYGQAQWKCRCECGNITVALGTKLRQGRTKSCGCLKREAQIVDLTGQVFGDLTVVCLDKENKKKGSHWYCKCSCGNPQLISYSAKSLKAGVSNCGCKSNSKGEKIIAQILNKFQINFEQEKTFSNLMGNKSALRFDFYLPEENICIEYQGEFHFKEIQKAHNNLKLQQEYDEKKRQFCKAHNLQLIEIPYWDFDKINEQYLLNLIKGEMDYG